MTIRTWRNLHRWTGLILLGFVGFYCLTGLLLNHRQNFNYFQEKKKSVTSVPVSDPGLVGSFIDIYKKQINREDDPTVIRIRGRNTIEFLYGSHGKTTYIIDPEKGIMETVEKVYRQPWSWLNDLHKAFKTSFFWVGVTDAAAAGILFLGISGLLLFRFKPLDYWLLCGGIVIMASTILLS